MVVVVVSRKAFDWKALAGGGFPRRDPDNVRAAFLGSE